MECQTNPKVFLACYANFQLSHESCDALFEVIQGQKERTHVYVNRFIKAFQKVHNYNEELALVAIKKELRDRRSGTLRFASLAQNFKILQQLLLFAEGFMQGEEDVEGQEERQSLSTTPPKGKNSKRKMGCDRQRDMRQKGESSDSPPEYQHSRINKRHSQINKMFSH
jgi:hypothetical protein